tara:strand:+ start:12922 stop:13050 length:129 start_codon:yes stop_codon:yes gene_type:complete
VNSLSFFSLVDERKKKIKFKKKMDKEVQILGRGPQKDIVPKI